MSHRAISEQRLKRFCQAQRIRRLSLFGSTLAGTAGPIAISSHHVETRGNSADTPDGA
jgi:hypothetical protein